MKYRTKATARMLVSSVGLLGLLVFVSRGRAEEQRVEVRADQTTTVIGTFDSLSGLLAGLCARAGAELRAFDAPDRPVTARQVGRPLADVIAVLLSRENYLLGVRASEQPGQPAFVEWIRVTGAKPADDDVLAGGITVPAPFGTHDFDDERPDQTRRARRAVADRLTANPEIVARLLAMDPAQLARSLRQYPHIADLLREIRAQQEPDVQRQLDAVLVELGEAPPPKE